MKTKKKKYAKVNTRKKQDKKENKKKENKKKEKGKIFLAVQSLIQIRYSFVAALVFVVVLALAVTGYMELKNYEDSVLSMYANQQDNYVQLVIDQIRIQKNSNDEEIINNILGSIDTSGQKYWTLTKEQALLFVKNVTETNRYKGFTTATYFVSDSAKVFLNGLQEDKVTHNIIYMGEDRYIASGAIFSFQGNEYKVCLLTGADVILDQNDFLSAEISVIIYGVFILLFILIVGMILTKIVHTQWNTISDDYRKIIQLNLIIADLNKQIRYENAYNTRWNVYIGDLLDEFIKKLVERGVSPISLVRIEFKSKEDRIKYLEQAQLIYDDRILRFYDGEDKLILLFIQFKEIEVDISLGRVSVGSPKVLNKKHCAMPGEALENAYKEFGKPEIVVDVR